MSHKIFDNDLVVIRKNETPNKPANIGMCTPKLHKVLMYKFHYDYFTINMETTQDYYYDSLMYEFKTGDVYEDFSNNKEMFDFSNYATKSKY